MNHQPLFHCDETAGKHFASRPRERRQSLLWKIDSVRAGLAAVRADLGDILVSVKEQRTPLIHCLSGKRCFSFTADGLWQELRSTFIPTSVRRASTKSLEQCSALLAARIWKLVSNHLILWPMDHHWPGIVACLDQTSKGVQITALGATLGRVRVTKCSNTGYWLTQRDKNRRRVTGSQRVVSIYYRNRLKFKYLVVFDTFSS